MYSLIKKKTHTQNENADYSFFSKHTHNLLFYFYSKKIKHIHKLLCFSWSPITYYSLSLSNYELVSLILSFHTIQKIIKHLKLTIFLLYDFLQNVLCSKRHRYRLHIHQFLLGPLLLQHLHENLSFHQRLHRL